MSLSPILTQPLEPATRAGQELGSTIEKIKEELKTWSHDTNKIYCEGKSISCYASNEKTNKLIYCCSSDVKVVDMATGDEISFSRSNGGEIKSMDVTSDFSMLILGHSSGKISLGSTNLENWMYRNLHDTAVIIIQILPGNESFASCSESKDIALWGIDGSILTKYATHHTMAITCMQVAGDFILTGSEDTQLIKWNLESPNPTHVFHEHKSSLTCIKLNKESTEAITGSYDSVIRMWDLKKNTLSGILQGHKEGVLCLLISPDEKNLISAGIDRAIIIWDLESHKELAKLTGHKRAIKDMIITSDCNHFATCSADGTIRLWNLKYPREQGVLRLKKKEILKISFHNDKIVSMSNSDIRVWELNECSREKVITYSGEPLCIAVCKDGLRNILAVGDPSDESILKVYDMETEEIVCQLNGVFDIQINKLCFSSDGKYLAMACNYSDTTVKVVEMALLFSTEKNLIGTLKSCKSENSISKEDKKIYVTKIAVTNSGSLIIGFSDGIIEFWDITQDKPAQKVDPSAGKHLTAITALEIAGENQEKLLSGSKESLIICWSLTDFQVLQQYNYQVIGKKIETRCLVSISQDLFASGSDDSIIRIWRYDPTPIQTGEVYPKVIKGHDKAVKFLQLTNSSGKAQLVSASADCSIRIWDIEASGSEFCRLLGHTETITGLYINPKSKYIVSSSRDSSVRIWNIKERREEIILECHSKEVTCICVIDEATNLGNKITPLSEDESTAIGYKIASLSKDETVRIWSDRQSGDLDLIGAGTRVDALCAMLAFKDLLKISPNQAGIIISKHRLNFAHFFCQDSKDDLLKAALDEGCDIRTDTEGNSALKYAIDRQSIKCVDTIITFLSKLKDRNRFLRNCHAIRNDFNRLMVTSSRCLPIFLESIFVVCGDGLPNLATPIGNLPMLKLGISTRIDPSVFIKIDENSQEKVLIEFRPCVIELPVIRGSQASLDMLNALLECENTKIFRCNIIKTILQDKWSNIIWVLYLHAVLLLVNLGLLSFLMIDDYRDLLGLQIAYIVDIVALTGYELLQLTEFKKYIMDPWNRIDMAMILCGVAWMILTYLEIAGLGYDIVCGFTIILSFIRGISGFRVFEPTRFYVKLILHSISRVVPFMIIFAYSTYGFGVIFSKAKIKNDDYSTFDYYWKMPFDLSMGSFDSDTNYEMHYVCFMITSIINVIIMLNLLISILGDAFDEFQVENVELDQIEKLEGILEVEKMYSRFTQKDESKYIHICDKISYERQEDDWQGKVRAFENKITKLSQKIDDEFIKMEGIFDKMAKENDHSHLRHSISKLSSRSEQRSETLQEEILKSIREEKASLQAQLLETIRNENVSLKEELTKSINAKFESGNEELKQNLKRANS